MTFAGTKSFSNFLSVAQSSLDVLGDKRKNIICIQWFVVIATAYLVLFKNGQVLQGPLRYGVSLGALGSILVVQRLPAPIFERPSFSKALVLMDTLLFSLAISLNRESPWDTLLIFYFGVFIAIIGENLIQVVLSCLLLSVISVVIVPLSQNIDFRLSSDALFRVSLLFGASILYGYLAGQVKAERRKKTELEQTLEQRLQLKNQFLSHVSHELRSPLSAIYQFVTILIDGLAGEVNSEQREYLEIIHRNAKQLRNMIDELLESTRADTNKLIIDRQCISIKDLTGDVLASTLPTAAAKGINLSADVAADLPLVYADPERVKQILVNLVGNAVKFTPANGTITMRARVYEQDANFVCTTVTDNGCGISPEGTKRIFDRLYQETESLDKNRQGLGLGLYICKELTTLHGGRIWVESKLGKGSSFSFTLPKIGRAHV